MKGKQAILRYLETHRTFTAKDVATECGMTINCITKNAIELERANKLVRLSKVWRTVTYRMASPEETGRNGTQLHQSDFQRVPAEPGHETNFSCLRESAGMNNEIELTAALLTIEKCRELSVCPAGVDLQDWVKQLAAENVGLKNVFSQKEIPSEAVDAFMETAVMDHDWNETSEWSWVENETEVIHAVSGRT